MIDCMIDRIAAETGWKGIRVVATGGLSRLLEEKTKRIQFIEPFLTLEGMRLIYHRVMDVPKQGGKA
jgi:type III pantothenate kinase